MKLEALIPGDNGTPAATREARRPGAAQAARAIA